MTREQVPDELLAKAMETYEIWATGHPRRDVARMLAAVLPIHERQVREQVARAIEDTVCAPPAGHTRPCPDCYRYRQMKRDARIARGER